MKVNVRQFSARAQTAHLILPRLIKMFRQGNTDSLNESFLWEAGRSVPREVSARLEKDYNPGENDSAFLAHTLYAFAVYRHLFITNKPGIVGTARRIVNVLIASFNDPQCAGP